MSKKSFLYTTISFCLLSSICQTKSYLVENMQEVSLPTSKKLLITGNAENILIKQVKKDTITIKSDNEENPLNFSVTRTDHDLSIELQKDVHTNKNVFLLVPETTQVYAQTVTGNIVFFGLSAFVTAQTREVSTSEEHNTRCLHMSTIGLKSWKTKQFRFLLNYNQKDNPNPTYVQLNTNSEVVIKAIKDETKKNEPKKKLSRTQSLSIISTVLRKKIKAYSKKNLRHSI